MGIVAEDANERIFIRIVYIVVCKSSQLGQSIGLRKSSVGYDSALTHLLVRFARARGSTEIVQLWANGVHGPHDNYLK